ncbi:MAG: PhoH family protein [Lachnospirales bacterium]
MQIKDTINTNAILLAKVFGDFDGNIGVIEKNTNTTINSRGENIFITGEKEEVEKAKMVLLKLLKKAESSEITSQFVNYLLDMKEDENFEEVEKLDSDVIARTISNKAVKPKTVGQKRYVDAIKNNTVVFGVGPAGTGKTYLAMAMAIKSFKNNEVNRIILTRPAIEAGEHLGFLPGDLQQKVDPYLRPLYDALYEIMGAENFLKNMEKGLIEVAPLAYMRGRTLDNAFIVLDEAQNTTPEQMKMFLTRIGFGSKVCITGDITQIDLPYGKKSGLEVAINILDNIEDISVIRFSNKDVVRHPLVQSIIKAYEKADKEKEQIEKKQAQKEAKKIRDNFRDNKRVYIQKDSMGNPIRRKDRT